MMPSFDGVSGAKRKVDLRGRSAGAAPQSKEALLAEARREREARAAHKARTAGATALQAAWRGGVSRASSRAQAGLAWRAAFGDTGERVDSASAASLPSTLLPQLLLFARASAPADVPLLAAACRAAASPGAPPALCAAWAAADARGRPRLLLRAQRLAALSLEALGAQAAALAPDLAASPAQAAQRDATALARAVAALTDRAAWRDDAAADACAAWLLRRGALRHLRALFTAAAPEPAPGAPPAPPSELGALVLHLLLRAAALVEAAEPADASIDSPPARLIPDAQLPAVLRDAAELLALPQLLRRCGGLAAALPALWPAMLRLLPAEGLASRLAPAGGAYPPAAWLLGTLLEAAPAAAASAASAARRAAQTGADANAAAAASSARDVAMRFAAAAQALLAALPGAMGTGDDDGLEAAGGPAPMVTDDAAHAPPPPALAAQLALLSDGAMLRDLALVLLPAPDGGVIAPAEAASALRLCALLQAALGRLRGAERGRLLSSLAFAAGLVPRLWACVRSLADASPAGGSLAADAAVLPPLTLLCAVYSHALLTADDAEFYEAGRPLPLAENARLVTLLRDTLWRLLWADGGGASASASAAASMPAGGPRGAATEALARLFQQLHSRNARRPFAPPDAFFRAELARHDALAERLLADAAAAAQAADEEDDAAGGDGTSPVLHAPSASRAARLLAAAPALAPFALRAELFRDLCAADREAAEMRSGAGPFGFGAAIPSVTVRRDQLFEDGLQGLGALPAEALRGRVRIQFVNALGAPEAGVDGGGLFKDFLDDLVKGAFDPRHGLWRETAGHALYPDPAAFAPEHLRRLRFMGAVLGKALREGILAELPLAAFFLARLRGDALGLDDLASMDAEMHRSLLFLKRFDGDHAPLCLTFTVARDADGAEVPLMPRGAETAVTAENKRAYIQLVAHYKLVAQLRPQVDAFLAGFHALVRPSWVRMFAPGELGQLIGGSREGLSVADLRRWVVYSGGFSEQHPTMLLLWQALEELAPQQQAAFLKFVTAVSRPPLLGFKALEPRFCVHRAGVAASDAPDESADTERLPTAATCMNLLKLPPYRRKEDLVQKLLYAISANAGFDLS